MYIYLYIYIYNAKECEILQDKNTGNLQLGKGNINYPQKLSKRIKVVLLSINICQNVL